MKILFKNKLVLTRNRQMILLNFSLIWVATILSGLAFDSLFAAFMGGLIGSIVFRILFARGNRREFNAEFEPGKDATITASNGLIFKRKHKRIVVSVMVFAAVFSWTIGVLIKSPYLPDFIPHIIILFLFQLIVKSTLFILDLPIGTFNEDQRNAVLPNNPHTNSSKSSSDIYYSPLYSHLSCNMNHDRWR